MKNIYLAITFAAILFATNITRVYAQNDKFLVPESNYNGHGVTLADLSFENKNGKGLSERIMFYNVGKKKFLNAGGKWGTRAATQTAGLSLQLENQSGTGSNATAPFLFTMRSKGSTGASASTCREVTISSPTQNAPIFSALRTSDPA